MIDNQPRIKFNNLNDEIFDKFGLYFEIFGKINLTLIMMRGVQQIPGL